MQWSVDCWFAWCLVFILLSLPSFSQIPQRNCEPVNYSGQVVLNTATGNGLAGVQILINGLAGPISSQAKIGPQSTPGGNFRYTLADCPGTLVRVQALKKDYSIVNHVENTGHVLRADLASSQRQFLVILSLDKEIEQRRMDYYAKLADLNFTKELERLKGRNEELEKLLAQSNKNSPTSSKIIEELATTKALIQQALEDRKAQEEQAQQIARVFAKLATTDIDSIYLKAFAFYRQGKLAQAQQQLSNGYMEQEQEAYQQEQQMATQLTQSADRKKRFWISKALLKANLYQAQYDFSQARQWYEKAVRADITHLENILTYADFLQDQNRAKEPEQWYQRALTLQPTQEQKARIFNNLGNFYAANNRPQEAETAYLQAKQSYEWLVQRNAEQYEPDLAMILNNLGAFYAENNRSTEAELAYLQAKQIRERLAQRNAERHEPGLALIMNNLGNFYKDNNRPKKAEAAYLQAKQIYERLVMMNANQYEPGLASTLNNLGVFYNDNNRPKEAEAAYLQAKQIYKRLAQQNTDQYEPGLANVQTNLGIFYNENSRAQEAEVVYLQAKQIRERLAQRNAEQYEPDLAMTLTNLGIFYYKNSHSQEAEIAFLQAKQIYERLVQRNAEQYEPNLANILMC